MSDRAEPAKPRRLVPPVYLYDVKLSRVQISTSYTKVLEENPRRVAIIFTTSFVGTYEIWPEQQASSPFGIPFGLSTGPIILKFNDHPKLVTGPWWCIEPSFGGWILVSEEIAVP